MPTRRSPRPETLVVELGPKTRRSLGALADAIVSASKRRAGIIHKKVPVEPEKETPEFVKTYEEWAAGQNFSSEKRSHFRAMLDIATGRRQPEGEWGVAVCRRILADAGAPLPT